MSSRVRQLAVGMGLGGTSLWAYQVAKYRRTWRRFSLPEPPRPGTAEFSRLVTVMTEPRSTSATARLLEAGARIFEYDQTMLHAKVLLIDHRWANVGSGNLDSRSLDLGLEVNVAMTDADLVGELEEHFLDDLDVSREMACHEEWCRIPNAWGRIG